jgi:uncharacterized protein (TIGR03546 family)
MIILRYLAKLLKILRDGATPAQIAGGFALGMIIGLTPVMSLHNLVVLLLLIFLNVNLSMAILSFTFMSGLAYLFDPWFHSIGYFLLVDIASLNGMWTWLYNVPVLALSRFNNTVVLGSLVVSLILFVPVWLLVKAGVIAYREHIDARMQKWKIVQVVKGSKLYNWYEKLKAIGD